MPFFDTVSLSAIAAFFDDLPPRLLSDGVLFDAPFATMTVRDAWKCGDDPAASSLLGFTDRGFNVFQLQVGDAAENAFPSDAEPVFGDLMMTVLRHEVSHQFDRVVDADSKLSALERLIRSHCDSDDDYLRSQVGRDYFDSAPQEIVASQVGNQYFLDSPAQLRLALHRMDADSNPLPISWILFFFELIGSGSNTVTLYKESSPTTGYTDSVQAELQRDADGRIVGLVVPGCDPFTFDYALNGLVAAYSGPADCTADFSKNSASYTDPDGESQAAGSSPSGHGATPWNVVAVIVVVVIVVAAGCCLVMVLSLWFHRRKRSEAMADGVGVDAENEVIVEAVADDTEYDMTSIGTAMNDESGGGQEEEIVVNIAITETTD